MSQCHSVGQDTRVPGRRLTRAVGLLSPAVAMCVLVSHATLAAAQSNAMLSGRVLRASTGEPLAGAQILVLGTGIETQSAEGGWYLLTDMPPGLHQVRAHLPGFETKILISTLREGGAGLLEFSLVEDPVALEELVVAGSEPGREVGNTVATVDGSVFEVTAVTDINAVLRDLVGGVHGITSSGQVGSGTSIRLRGPASVTQGDAPLVYLDGIRLPTRRAPGPQGTGQAVSVLDMISADDIARIQVLRGASATARYGMNASSGVILIYTKRGSRPN